MTHIRRKLIEVALPLEAINKESLHRKQKAPKGWPTSFHKWWAQRPLAAARAVIFAQMVDDPSSYPDLFRTEKAQEKERERLFHIIEDLVKWENTSSEKVLQKARGEIWQSWRRACAENADHPKAKDLFDRYHLPAFYDPFSGGGSIPLSAQWLGLESYAADLNPVAVLINKAMIEIPPMFAGKPPVNPQSRAELARGGSWNCQGAQGLAEDVRYYGQWMRDEAERRIGHLYPKFQILPEMIVDREDLKPYVGKELTVIAWLWARTVKSPNPAFANVDVPLASTFLLSTKAGKEVYVEPVIEGGAYRFAIKVGKPRDAEAAKNGTKLSRGANFRCLLSDAPIGGDYIKSEAKSGRMGVRLMAIVAEGARGRVYLAPTSEHEAAACKAQPSWRPDVTISGSTQYLGVKPYGFDRFDQLFTDRQLESLTVLTDLIKEVREKAQLDGVDAGLSVDERPLHDKGAGSVAYSDALAVYLAFVIDRIAFYGSSLCGWLTKDNAMGKSMPQQALAMSWDFAEGNPFAKSSGDIITASKAISNYLDLATPGAKAHAIQCDAQTGVQGLNGLIVSTDPPYYDNVPYADLSDFFYVWLRRSLKDLFPDLFSTVAVPKNEELVAFAYRHNEGKVGAEDFFLKGMTKAMQRLSDQSHPAFPITIYYAFKQSQSDGDTGTASTGWEVFLGAVIRAGLGIYGTWPLRTEGESRMRGFNSNALATSIILVCRPRAAEAPIVTRREFVSALKAELPSALRNLQAGNIAPVDLAQAAIGPGMGVYTRYAKVVDAEGKAVSVREALALINATLDEALAEQEGDFDADSRWALAWFEQIGFNDGEYGVAETLSKAKNTSVAGLASSGILDSRRGKVRLLRPDELSEDWDPSTDPRLTAWEVVHHLIRVLGKGGESAAADLVVKLGVRAESARELAYRLYTICERKKRAGEALAYNGLVQSWPEIVRLAQEGSRPATTEPDLFAAGER